PSGPMRPASMKPTETPAAIRPILLTSMIVSHNWAESLSWSLTMAARRLPPSLRLRISLRSTADNAISAAAARPIKSTATANTNQAIRSDSTTFSCKLSLITGGLGGLRPRRHAISRLAVAHIAGHDRAGPRPRARADRDRRDEHRIA